MERKVVGQTIASGFQIGVRRTLPISAEQAWSYLTSRDGLAVWLGETADFELQPKSRYTTSAGADGEVRVVKHAEQLRLTWRKPGWTKPSTVQIRLIPNETGKTTVSFHQENMADAATRDSMKEHWEAVLERLRRAAEPIS